MAYRLGGLPGHNIGYLDLQPIQLHMHKAELQHNHAVGHSNPNRLICNDITIALIVPADHNPTHIHILVLYELTEVEAGAEVVTAEDLELPRHGFLADCRGCGGGCAFYAVLLLVHVVAGGALVQAVAV